VIAELEGAPPGGEMADWAKASYGMLGVEPVVLGNTGKGFCVGTGACS
jgi:hypothetical protein